MSSQDNAFNTSRAEEQVKKIGPQNGVVFSGTSNATPNTEDSYPHVLGSVPNGFIIINKDKAGDFYEEGTTAWTDSAITLGCTVASVTFTGIVF